MTASKEKAMEKAIEFLLQSGTDITIQSEGKSILLLALESADPLTTTRVLLRAALWRDINKPFNQYNDGKYTFSPTMYVQHVLSDSDLKTDLLRLLRSNRCTDIYYANSGPQVSFLEPLMPPFNISQHQFPHQTFSTPINPTSSRTP